MIVTKPLNSTDQHREDCASVKLLFVVEGTNDIEFLRRISRLLHQHAEQLPNLEQMEQQGELIFLPFGGGHVSAWSTRMSPLGIPEFHLYDHELPPETSYREEAAAIVNRRERCRAVVTRKRSLENYLHPEAIRLVGEFEVSFDDFDSVAEATAKQLYRHRPYETPWELLTSRNRSRSVHRAKRWLNTHVADAMTLDMLRQRDPAGEVIGWLEEVSRLIECQ